jgi:hypothetical protein
MFSLSFGIFTYTVNQALIFVNVIFYILSAWFLYKKFCYRGWYFVRIQICHCYLSLRRCYQQNVHINGYSVTQDYVR